MKNALDENRERQHTFWEGTAADTPHTHPDPYQSELELDFMLRHIGAEGRVLNVGCGAGYETRRCSDAVGFAVGVDFSESMIRFADNRYADSHTRFRVADALNLSAVLEEFGAFNVVTSRRLLINMISWEDQQRVIRELRGCLKPGGKLILIEASEAGYAGLNELRAKAGLPTVKVASFNHVLPPEYDAYMGKGWKLLDEGRLSTYYFLTRIFYPTVETPAYGSEFARRCAELQRLIGDVPVVSPILMRCYEKT